MGKLCRILIVEDLPDARDSLRVVLELLDYEVEVAADGVEGVRKALAWRPDVAVVDIGLPRLSGYEVAKQVRSELGNKVVLIALTAYTSPEDRQRAYDVGFNVHLPKPADVEELCRLLALARL